MMFSDFKQSDLVGKLVLYSTSENVVNSETREVTTIAYSDKKGFKIQSQPEKFFNYRGQQLACARRVTWQGISRCRLITDQEAKELQDQLLSKDQIKQLINIIVSNKDKLMLVEPRFLKTIVNKIQAMG